MLCFSRSSGVFLPVSAFDRFSAELVYFLCFVCGHIRLLMSGGVINGVEITKHLLSSSGAE